MLIGNKNRFFFTRARLFTAGRATTNFLPVLVTLLGCAAGAEATTAGAPPPPRVYRDKVEPKWFADNQKFWYRVNTGPDAHEFVLVDAVKGQRSLAFDHEKLARALERAGGPKETAANLSLQDLEFGPQLEWVNFRAGGKQWRFDSGTGAVTERAAQAKPVETMPLENAPRASRRTGEETSLRLVNRTQVEVLVYWLDSDGNRQSFGKLAPGEVRAQHTFSGHVWLVTDAAGKTLAVWQAENSSSEVEITSEPKAHYAQPQQQRRRRREPGPATSPDGQWRVVVKEHNLVLQPVKGGQDKALTTDGTAEDAYEGQFFWSPDSRKLAALKTRPAQEHKVYLVESSPKDQVQPKLHTLDYLKPGDRIAQSKPHLFDVTTGTEIPVEDALFANPWSIQDLRWSSDSARFSFVYNQRGHQVLRVVAVAADSGKASALIDERSETFINYSGKYFYSALDRSGEMVWMSERDGWNHLYLYDAATGQLKNQVTKGRWVVREVDRVDEDKRQIWFRAGGIRPEEDPYFVHYCRVNFDGTGLVVLTGGNGTHTAQFSPDHRYLVDTWSRVDQAPITVLRSCDDGRELCLLEAPNTGELATAKWRLPEPFVAKGRDGETDIYGIIHWPQAVDPARKYPVIESIYAGPQDSYVPKSFRISYGQEKLTRHGFVVVEIDGMGTANRSKKFHDVCWRNLVDAGLPDRVAWIRAAAAKHPCLDLGRVGIYGGSAGGQNALGALLTHGDFYKAGVADCGCHDNRMDKIWWNEQWMGWPIGPHYGEQSNVTLAPNLKGKLFLMVGEMDSNVDPASTMQVVNALVKADKDFDLLVLPGSNHGVLGSPYAQRRMLDFFTRALQPDAPATSLSASP